MGLFVIFYLNHADRLSKENSSRMLLAEKDFMVLGTPRFVVDVRL